MKNAMHPYIRFGIFAAAMQILMLNIIIFYDYGFERNNLTKNSDIIDIAFVFFQSAIIVIPTVLYLLMKKKFFSTEDNITDSLIHIAIWAAVSLVLIFPVFRLASIVSRSASDRGSFMLEVEFFFIMISDGIIAIIMMLCTLISEIVKKTKAAKKQQTGVSNNE